MRKIILGLMVCVGFASCYEKPQELKPIDIKAKVDSIVKVRTVELNRQAAEDLDLRIAIEVKPKTDSIVAAEMKRRSPVIAPAINKAK